MKNFLMCVDGGHSKHRASNARYQTESGAKIRAKVEEHLAKREKVFDYIRGMPSTKDLEVKTIENYLRYLLNYNAATST